MQLSLQQKTHFMEAEEKKARVGGAVAGENKIMQ